MNLEMEDLYRYVRDNFGIDMKRNRFEEWEYVIDKERSMTCSLGVCRANGQQIIRYWVGTNTSGKGVPCDSLEELKRHMIADGIRPKEIQENLFGWNL